ncbi:MAG: hypothetical protein N4A33_00990 [Bacteriovoracaceae bacterium]|jgi:hypothetical protein|nr:hypothetical protein [Bacteriovoracaceae bacterium]
MSNIISAIYEFAFVITLGSGITLIAADFKLAATKQAAKGSARLTTFSQKMTGESLDLSDERVYGKKLKPKQGATYK